MDFDGATIDFTPGAIAGLAVEGTVGEHGIFGGEPAAFDALSTHPPRDTVFDRGGADHAGIAEADEDGAGGVGCDAGLKGDGAEGIDAAAIGA